MELELEVEDASLDDDGMPPTLLEVEIVGNEALVTAG